MTETLVTESQWDALVAASKARRAKPMQYRTTERRQSQQQRRNASTIRRHLSAIQDSLAASTKAEDIDAISAQNLATELKKAIAALGEILASIESFSLPEEATGTVIAQDTPGARKSRRKSQNRPGYIMGHRVKS